MRIASRRKWVVAAALVASTFATAVPTTPVEAATIYNGAGSAPRVGIIADSVVAAIRWSNTFQPLRTYNYIYDAESCRRTTAASCRGREGYTPPTTLSTMRARSGQWGSVLVIGTGYDDPGFSFASSVDAIMAEAARQRIPKVMWMTMRTADVTYVGPTYRSNTYTFRDNNRILLQKAQQYGGRLVIADWATYSASHPEWFYGDGIHLTQSGAWAVGEFIVAQAGRAMAGINITPSAASLGGTRAWATLRRGDRGAYVTALQQALINKGYPLFGGADGAFGAATEAALRRFQAANGLSANGVVDANTAIRLGIYNPGGVTASAQWTDLRYRMGGVAVARAQQALMSRGVFVRGGATGTFDIYTVYAVNTFQRHNGLRVSGVIDAATARKLGLYSGAWDDLRTGMTGSRVLGAQRALIGAGVFVRGGATGRFDVYTYYAVQTYQRWQGLPVTGVLDPETARRLGLHRVLSPNAVWITVRRGLVGADVAAAQLAMMNRGVFVRGGATGIFDIYTLYAVNTFQRHNGLSVTGVIDTATARKLGLFDLSNPTVDWTDIRRWATGPLVTRAQQLLMSRGVFVRGGATGVFDVYTYYAVNTFQRYNGLRVTGVIDIATARKLGMFGGASPATTTMAVTLAAGPLAASAAPAPPAPSTTTTTAPTSTTTTTTSTTTPQPTTSVQAETPDAVDEPALVTIGDLVWLDVDGDGRKDDDEAGIADVVVVLRDETDVEIGRVSTDHLGNYEFADLPVGSYRLEVELPADRTTTVADQGSDDLDSDAVKVEQLDELTRVGRTDVFTVDGAEPTDTFDVGLVPAPVEPSAPSSTGDTTAPPPPEEPTTTVAESQPTTSLTESTATAATTTTVAPTSTTLAPPTTMAVATTASTGG